MKMTLCRSTTNSLHHDNPKTQNFRTSSPKESTLVLQQLRNNNLHVHVEETFLASQKVDYLGYTLTPSGIEPQAKKILASHNLFDAYESHCLCICPLEINFGERDTDGSMVRFHVIDDCCENPNTSTDERRECMDEEQPTGRV